MARKIQRSATPPSKPQQVLRGNVADQIFEFIREEILTGKYVRGSKLPTEKVFASMFGVSSVTIRAAMRSLAAAHLIEVKQGSGSYVTAQTDQLLATSLRSMIQVNSITATEILTVLGGMNGFAAELAAARITEDDLLLMQQALDDVLQRTSVSEISAALKSFLDLLADASGSSLLASFCRYLSELQIALAWQISDGTLEGWQSLTASFAKERQTILNCLRKRDAEAARNAAMSYHKSTCNLISALPKKRRTHLNSSVSNVLADLLSRR